MTEQDQRLQGPPAAGKAPHTPAPWTLRQAMKYGPGSNRDKVNWVPDPGRFDINGPDGDMPSIAEDVWEPDARLMAAAPDLAVALKWMLNDDSAEARAAAEIALHAAGYVPVGDDEPEASAPKAPSDP